MVDGGTGNARGGEEKLRPTHTDELQGTRGKKSRQDEYALPVCSTLAHAGARETGGDVVVGIEGQVATMHTMVAWSQGL